MQIRIDADVAAKIRESAVANDRSVVREANSILRRVFKLKPKRRALSR